MAFVLAATLFSPTIANAEAEAKAEAEEAAVEAAAGGEAQAIWGAPIESATATLALGAVLQENTYWTGADYRRENYITLEPGGALLPSVASWDPLLHADGLESMAAVLEVWGMHVVAGVNGGFFTLSSYVPVGMVARDGVLRSDPEWMKAIGFRADGSAVIGTPDLAMGLSDGGNWADVEALNRDRGEGLTVYTADFAANTRAEGWGWNLFCIPDGPIPISGAVGLTVTELRWAEGGVAIPEGQMVLSLAGQPPDWLESLGPGDELTLSVSCGAEWRDVESALSLLYPLISQGEVLDELETIPAPRTAVGLRADGGLVLYTVDGRQTGFSVGAGLRDVALRLRELGCVEAGALDGGGSTLLRAVLPGDAALTQINRPSDGSPRNVVNYVVLTTTAPPTGVPARLALYPLDIHCLQGSQVELTVKAVDENGWPAPLPEELSFTVEGEAGRVENGRFLAEGQGGGSITVSAPGLAPATIPVDVTVSPDEIGLYGERYGRRTVSLTLAPGEEVGLDARAFRNHVKLEGDDSQFAWRLDPAAGTVDAWGHIVPAPASGSGYLTVSAGDTATRIPIRIWSGVPFQDVPVTDPRFAGVRYVYETGLFNGVSDTAFAPDTVMNRAMLVTVLWRMCQSPEPAGQAGFSDVPADAWYAQAVAWATETGLVTGYDEDHFGPLDDLTKEQILTILHRFAGSPWSAGNLERYPDAGQAADYALPALRWAEAAGILRPEEDGTLRPGAPMDRASVAVVLMLWNGTIDETGEGEAAYGAAY